MKNMNYPEQPVRKGFIPREYRKPIKAFLWAYQAVWLFIVVLILYLIFV